MIFPMTLRSGGTRYVVRFPNPAGGQKLRQSYPTRELAEKAVASYKETGQMPVGPKRTGRPKDSAKKPQAVQRKLANGTTRWQSAARWRQDDKYHYTYLPECDTREEAIAQAAAYIATGIEPPRPAKPPRAPKPAKVPKKRGPKPGFKMAPFVPRVNPSGADRWREVYEQRIA